VDRSLYNVWTVSEENIDLVKRIYALWAAGEPAGELVDDNLEYVNPSYAVESGTRHDRGALAAIREIYPDFRMEPERYVDVGDEVVVLGVARGTSVSGLEAQWRQGYVWTIRDGRAVRFRWFNDPAEALAAVGLEE
jgi:ketosteroid isomerase-like protein